MTTTGDDSDLFEADVLASAAAARDVDEDDLASVVARHQERVEELPGVENLAYEWRKQYESPLIERTPGAYFLAVPAWVWDEFGESLDIRDATLDALTEVHRRTAVSRTDVTPQPSEQMTYVVLDRTVGDASTE